MLSNIISALALSQLYRFLKNDYTSSPLYKAGLIDRDGNRIVPTSLTIDQKGAMTPFNMFALSLKKIISNNPVIKYKVLKGLVKAIFLRENVDIKFYKFKDQLVVEVHKSDEFYTSVGTVCVFGEAGSIVTALDNLVEVSLKEALEEDMVTTSAVATVEKPLEKEPIMRNILKLVRKKKTDEAVTSPSGEDADDLKKIADELAKNGSDKANAARKSDD